MLQILTFIGLAEGLAARCREQKSVGPVQHGPQPVDQERPRLGVAQPPELVMLGPSELGIHT